MKPCNLDMIGNILVLVRERDNTIIARNISAGEKVEKDFKGRLTNVDWESAEKQANMLGYTLY